MKEIQKLQMKMNSGTQYYPEPKEIFEKINEIVKTINLITKGIPNFEEK